MMNRYKRDNYRQELDQCLQYKQIKETEVSGQNMDAQRQDIQNIQYYA